MIYVIHISIANTVSNSVSQYFIYKAAEKSVSKPAMKDEGMTIRGLLFSI